MGRPKSETKAPKTGGVGPSGNYEENKECPVCQMKGHDGRAHRTHKEKFTDDDLLMRGLAAPDSRATQVFEKIMQ